MISHTGELRRTQISKRASRRKHLLLGVSRKEKPKLHCRQLNTHALEHCPPLFEHWRVTHRRTKESEEMVWLATLIVSWLNEDQNGSYCELSRAERVDLPERILNRGGEGAILTKQGRLIDCGQARDGQQLCELVRGAGFRYH